jgi:aerobic carbon-monoxide dehydrogenase small subunit
VSDSWSAERGSRPDVSDSWSAERGSRPDVNSATPGPDSLSYALEVNGSPQEVPSAWLGESLLYVLRERLGLPGSKNACDQGECGSCSVLLDGVLVCSCCVLAADAVDAEVRTVEGLAQDGALTDVQRCFLEAGAVQCGFCTPGLVMAVHDLLDRSPDADELEVREAISGNLCRCTGYGRILGAICDVQAARGGGR